MSYSERVIVLVDMDCFYCQVEEKLDPNLEGKPIAVVQYNTWRGGGIIAVNYPAREKGVSRHMRGDEAKQKCPDIVLARVPEVRGKADLTKYRDAGKNVADVLQTFSPLLERASVDEAYLDITEVVNRRIETAFDQLCINNLQNTYVVGYDIEDFLFNVKNGYSLDSNLKLVMGGLIAEEIRAAVYDKTGYKCSAGIAHNKILAKVVCGLHKPNKQTILPQESIPELYKNLPLKKIPGLGGKLGKALSNQLNITNMGELIISTEKQLVKLFEEKTAKWLYNLARGIDYDPVTPRLISKSIGCCKNFTGKNALISARSVEHWVNELTSEISERLEKDVKDNNRKAKQITLHFTHGDNKEITNSRTVPLNSYDQPKIYQTSMEVLKKYCQKSDGTYCIKYLGLSVGNFDVNKKRGNITELFKNMRGFQSVNNEIPQKNIYLQELNSFQESIPTEANIAEKSVTTPANQMVDSFPKLKTIDNDIGEEKNLSNEDREDHASVYSADTEELDEDTSGLIYYEDIYPERVTMSINLIEELSKNSTIKENINNKSNCNNLCSNQTSSAESFFSKYFEEYSVPSKYCVSPIDRNFDTSKVLEELESSDEFVDPYNEVTQEEIYTDHKTKLHNEFEREEVEDLTETCPKCKKNILNSQFGSHMDYHFALSIVKEEAHLYKKSTEISKKSVVPPIKEKDRKKKSTDMKSIHTFLQVDVLNAENSEACSQCNKRVKLEDLNSHIDYHAAMKLHLEINSKSALNVKASAKTENKKINKKGGDILQFLKKTEM